MSAPSGRIVQVTDENNARENAAVQSYGALLFREDPTGEAAVIMERVCDLSSADFERFRTAYKTMSDLLIANMFTYVRQCALDFLQLTMDASEAMRDGKVSPTRPDDVVMWGTKLRSSVLSLCSSVHHHQDQSYIEVKRKFGENSPEHLKMKSAFADIYDNCFGYRYLYKLRNTMVHFTMLATGMTATSQMHGDEKVAFVDMYMDRTTLLEQKGHLNQRLRAELQGLTENPSIYTMAGEMLPRLLVTNRRVLEILYPEIDDICATVVDFDSLFEGRTGIRATIHQQSPELRPPFTTGYQAWAGAIFDFAYARTQSRNGSTPPTSAQTEAPHSNPRAAEV